MSNLRDLLKRIRQWDALDIPDTDGAYWKREIDAALEQPEQEPVACNACVGSIAHVQHGLPIGTKLYTHPPRREWRGLSEEEIKAAVGASADFWATSALWIKSVASAVEAKLKELNHD